YRRVQRPRLIHAEMSRLLRRWRQAFNLGHHSWLTTQEGAMPDFPTITHVALTVTDLNRSVPWYEALFGSKPVLDEDTGPFRHVVWLLGGTLVGLHQFPDPTDAGPFDERRVGLDHLAFACATRKELEDWEGRLNKLGVVN